MVINIHIHEIMECKLCRVSSNFPGHELALAHCCAGARFGSTQSNRLAQQSPRG